MRNVQKCLTIISVSTKSILFCCFKWRLFLSGISGYWEVSDEDSMLASILVAVWVKLTKFPADKQLRVRLGTSLYLPLPLTSQALKCFLPISQGIFHSQIIRMTSSCTCHSIMFEESFPCLTHTINSDSSQCGSAVYILCTTLENFSHTLMCGRNRTTLGVVVEYDNVIFLIIIVGTIASIQQIQPDGKRNTRYESPTLRSFLLL